MDHSVRNFLIKLVSKERISGSSVSGKVKSGIQNLREAGFIGWERSGRGGVYVARAPERIKKLLESTGYHGSQHLTPRASAVALHGDAHAGKNDTLIFHLSVKGTVCWHNHGKVVHLTRIINDCGMASLIVRPEDKWSTNSPIALVENLDLVVNADRYFKNIPFEGSIIYYAGWASGKTLEWLKQQNNPPRIILPDYDLIGLNNYLKLKNIFPEIKLYIPDNLEELVRRYGNAKRLKDQSGHGYRVVTDDADAQMVLTLIEKYGQCLDQEALILL